MRCELNLQHLLTSAKSQTHSLLMLDRGLNREVVLSSSSRPALVQPSHALQDHTRLVSVFKSAMQSLGWHLPWSGACRSPARKSECGKTGRRWRYAAAGSPAAAIAYDMILALIPWLTQRDKLVLVLIRGVPQQNGPPDYR